jgi:hypothetical protein
MSPDAIKLYMYYMYVHTLAPCIIQHLLCAWTHVNFIHYDAVATIKALYILDVEKVAVAVIIFSKHNIDFILTCKYM